MTRAIEQGHLIVRVLECGRTVELTEPFWVVVDGERFEVPVGFVSDFASVPRMFWWVVPPWGRYSPAAVLHDWIYFTQIVNRLEADQVFRDHMGALGVSAWKRNAMYRAVRIFGGGAYGASPASIEL